MVRLMCLERVLGKLDKESREDKETCQLLPFGLSLPYVLSEIGMREKNEVVLLMHVLELL